MAAPANVACPHCGASIASEDMNLSAMAARCRACRGFVDLRAAPPSTEYAPAVAEPLPLPPLFQVHQRGGGLTIVHRWFTWTYPVMGLFCAVWFGFLLFWYAIAVRPDTPLMMKLLPVVHVFVGIGISYVTVAGLLNRTEISLDRGRLTVRHAPLPWPGNVDVPETALERLFCTSKTVYQQKRPQTLHDVHAVLKDGRELKLIGSLDAREQALFVEQTLQRHLGISDRSLPSEMHG